jgi:hypothetical protein
MLISILIVEVKSKPMKKLNQGTWLEPREWGFNWFYEKLYGKLPDVWPQAT